MNTDTKLLKELALLAWPNSDNGHHLGGNNMDLRKLSLSHATHQNAHLAAAFLPLAEKNGFDKDNWEVPPEAWADDDHPWWYSESSYLMVEQMFYLLDSIAPKGYYFGAHPGNDSDFGFWECEN